MADANSYDAVHRRLSRTRGRAADHPCSAPTCDLPADQWSWQRTGPSRTADRHGITVTWGLDLDSYSPMCRSHAAMLDGGGTLTHCPRGHDRAAVGTRPNGRCAQCHRDEDRERWRANHA